VRRRLVAVGLAALPGACAGGNPRWHLAKVWVLPRLLDAAAP
jgi:hypothetical protein